MSVTADNKVYDGTTTATVTFSDDRIPGDKIKYASDTPLFDTKDEGNGKTVTVTNISISGKDVLFKKNSFRAKVLELLTKNDKAKRKVWDWEDVYEKVQGSDEFNKAGQDKVYYACRGIAESIASNAGITNFIIITTRTTQINPSFL